MAKTNYNTVVIKLNDLQNRITDLEINFEKTTQNIMKRVATLEEGKKK